MMECILEGWADGVRQQNGRLTGNSLYDKALELLKDPANRPSPERHAVADTWVDRFLRRNGLCVRRVKKFTMKTVEEIAGAVMMASSLYLSVPVHTQDDFCNSI